MSLIRESRLLRRRATRPPKHRCKPPVVLAAGFYQPDHGFGAVWECDTCKRQWVAMGIIWRPKLFKLNPLYINPPLTLSDYLGIGAFLGFIAAAAWIGASL